MHFAEEIIMTGNTICFLSNFGQRIFFN